ncbi:hypothetical protein [Ekhidna sp.]|uniref:hypothetical protein n=1 Tax=Ekhidna sp. TaxID=2608089 RepID=UPI003299774F
MNHDFNKRSKYAPLNIWVISAVTFIVINVIVYSYCAIFLDTRAKRFEKENLKALQELKENIEEFPLERHVVVVGSSVIRNALWCHDAFIDYQSRKAEEGSRKINIYKIYESGFQLPYFTNQLHLFDSLIKYQPDLILLEDHMLLTDFKRFKRGTVSDAYYDYKITLKRGKNSIFSKPKERDFCFSPSVVNTMDSLNVQVSYRRALSLSENEFFLEVLNAGKRREVHIGLLSSPRPSLFIEALSKTAANAEINNLRNYYLDQYGLDYIPFEEEFYWSYFLDEGHMNNIGQRRYSIWLLDRLEKHFSNQ